MDYLVENKRIIIKIPASNEGRFRFKKRKDNLEFGEIFSTREKNFDEEVYLEWQIGYDITIKDAEEGKKETKLKTKTFIGSNGKEKYPYELSELLYDSVNSNLIALEKIQLLLEEIKTYKNFIDERKIVVEHHSKVVINNMRFEEMSIKLPTLFMIETNDNTQIEVS